MSKPKPLPTDPERAGRDAARIAAANARETERARQRLILFGPGLNLWDEATGRYVWRGDAE